MFTVKGIFRRGRGVGGGTEGRGRGRKKKETYLRRIEKSKEWEEVVPRYRSGSKKMRRPFGEGGKRGIITYTYLYAQVHCDPVWPSGKALGW